jgi:predicted extracellular nuclease
MQHRAIIYTVLAATVLACSGCGFPLSAGGDMAAEPMEPGRRLIGQVQGSGAVSPLLGKQVLIEGVVVRSLTGDGDDIAQELGETLGEGNRGRVVGWFVQDEGDGDPATSDALFVLDRGYDTSLNMPAEAEFTMRMGNRVRSGDRIVVRGEVIEVPQADTAEQPRSAGHSVARGTPAETVTTLAASSITLLAPDERAVPLIPLAIAPSQAQQERVEGMRLSRIDNGASPLPLPSAPSP